MLTLSGMEVKGHEESTSLDASAASFWRYRGCVATGDVDAGGPSAPAIRAVAVLDDELRRGMYLYCREAGRPVTRDEAAAQVGISRKLAAFHLDKLVDAGLLQAHYNPVDGIRRVGRRPKVYEPTNDSVQVTIPERRHDLLADLLLDAVLAEQDGETAIASALRTAQRRGSELGAREREAARLGRLGAERALTLLKTILARHGFEPARGSATDLRLRNCPFHPFAAKAPALVCGINHAFLSGLLVGLESRGVQAELRPAPGECCVRLSTQR
jgi:predicted ArsR family transcriptional regulator